MLSSSEKVMFVTIKKLIESIEDEIQKVSVSEDDIKYMRHDGMG